MANAIDRINELRLKVRDGVEITKDEAAEALNLMREMRGKVAATAAEKEAKKAKAAPANLNDLW